MAGGGVGVEGHHFTFGRTAAPDNSTEGLRKWSEALQSSGSVESRTDEKYWNVLLLLHLLFKFKLNFIIFSQWVLWLKQMFAVLGNTLLYFQDLKKK